MIYLGNPDGTVRKATDKQWKDCVAEQLAWIWHRAPIDSSYRDLPATNKRLNAADLIHPEAWNDSDWVDEAYERGVYTDRAKRAMIEVVENVFVSEDGYHLSCGGPLLHGFWTLKDNDGNVVGEHEKDLKVMLRKNKLEIYWRFV